MVRSGVAKQYVAALAGNVSSLMVGVVLSWSSPALVNMDLTDEEKSWAGSLAALGGAVGPWLGGWATDRLGRRGTLLWNTAPALAGAAMLMAAERTPGLLFAARLLSGAAVGVVNVTLSMYIAEISQPSVRGALSTLMQLMISSGMLLVYAAGPYIPYLALGGIGLVFPLLFPAVFLWMPETPYYHLTKGDVAAAEKSLKWLRDEGADVSKELMLIKEAVDELRQSEASAAELFRARGNRRALCLSMGLMLLQQASGINAVLFYGQSIFEMTHTGLQPAVSQLLIGVVMVLGSCLSPFFADRLGRKPLLIGSAIGMGIADAALGVYFYLSANQDVSAIGWLPVTSLIFYIFVYSPGCGALPWAVLGELFPTNVKALASSLTGSFNWLMGFLITKFYSQISAQLGAYTPFWIFAACCFVGALLVALLLPETKGRRMEEIHAILDQR